MLLLFLVVTLYFVYFGYTHNRRIGAIANAVFLAYN